MISYAFSLPRRLTIVNLGFVSARFIAAVTLLWLMTYGWLAYRLFVYGLWIGWVANLFLAVITISLGVLVVLGWRRVGWQWLRGWRQGSKWRALSLAAMYRLEPSAFEDYVAYRIFARQGYQVLNTPDTKDGGIDVLITDEYGRQAVVQCKRYKGTVGSATVRELYGTMIHTGADRAYLATTAEISNDARAWAEGKPIILLDGQRLEQLARATPGSRQI
ncbi:MAG: restriction endonuclease [Caldilinea sp. CFX5]|nr:restriction endonuclease [Caldilinea sp. CFX5]